MDISRRKLLLGVAAVTVTPALPVNELLPPTWVPNPASSIVIEPKGEVFYGGARGGGMTMARFKQMWSDAIFRLDVEQRDQMSLNLQAITNIKIGEDQ